MDDPWVRPFLDHLARTGNASAAARVAGVQSATAYARRTRDADFAEAWRHALEDEHVDALEQEITRRALGYEEPVVYQGQLSPVWERDADGKPVLGLVEITDPKTGEITRVHQPVQARNPDGSLRWLTITKHSDTLLLAKVKAYRKRYATERTELTGADGGPVEMNATERAARIEQILEAARQRKAFGDLA